MYLGGQLIRQFDAFVHLFRAAADALHAPVRMPSEDHFALNRVLAGLGRPPGPAQVNVDLVSKDALPILCLYLIMSPYPCPVGLMAPDLMVRARQLVHVVAHAMVPMAAGGDALSVEDVSRSLTTAEVALHPYLTYNEDGEIASLQRSGGRNRLATDPGAGPYKVIINSPDAVELDTDGPLQPVAVQATWREVFPSIGGL